MAAVQDKKMISEPFSNEVELVRATWDFDVDGGAIGQHELLEAQGTVVVMLKAAIVLDPVLSGGALTLSVGEAAGAEFISAWPKANMDGDEHKSGLVPIKITSGEKVNMSLAVTPATRGKIEFIFEVMKVN